MKILTIAPANTPHALRPVRSLLDAGHSVLLFGYKQINDPLAGEYRPNYKYIAEKYPPGDTPVQHIENYAITLNALNKTFRPDIVHIHWISWHLPLCLKLNMHPIAVSVWGSDLNTSLVADSLGGFHWREDMINSVLFLKEADRLIVDDPTMPAKCAFAAPGVPVDILPLGADELFFESDQAGAEMLRKRLGLEHKYIFTSARLLAPVYRTPDIMAAFALAAKGKDAVLVLKKFLVEDRNVLKELSELAKRLGIEKQVRMCGPLSSEELRNLYKISTALINFPARDAFPVTFAEAAACGAKVITCWHPSYDVPLVRNYFDILAEDSVECLSESISTLMLDDFNGYRQNIIAAREMAAREYSHENYINGLIRVYSELLKQG